MILHAAQTLSQYSSAPASLGALHEDSHSAVHWEEVASCEILYWTRWGGMGEEDGGFKTRPTPAIVSIPNTTRILIHID